MNQKQQLIDRLTSKQARIGVVGLGYVGLPFAVTFAKAGFHVTGIELDAAKAAKVNAGESYILDVPTADVKELAEKGLLDATTDYSVVKDLDAVAICVPTPLRETGDPDISFIANATKWMQPYFHPGLVIVLESSTYPGTTREVILPEITATPGVTIGEDIFLGFSPERVDPGREDWMTKNTPKVLGGITPACTEVATAWYSQAINTIVQVTSPEVAEMSKLLENTFRLVNTALVNELALICNRIGIDVWEVVNAAATKPFGFMKFTPGPGVGGHCIPVDPIYLSWKMKSYNFNARFIELATEINENMPRYVIQRVQDALNDDGKALRGSKILVLGVAYKPNINDLRESPALKIIPMLQAKGAKVQYNDPFVPKLVDKDIDLVSVADLVSAVKDADCVVLLTGHKQYDYTMVQQNAKKILDTRNSFGDRGLVAQNIVRL